MTAQELRQLFLSFFQSKGHKVIPSASLIPENDPTVLFTTAGMHPLVPFLLGEKHPAGKRLCSVQKCIRTQDLEEVGDNVHLTFFEMLGNWSLGDYFKPEAIEWSFEFLTSKQWLGLPPQKIYISVFAGDQDAPKDEESIKSWQGQFKKVGIEAKEGERIFCYGKDKNWWGPAGKIGPCGPDTEMFYDTGKPHDPQFGSNCHPNCLCGRYIEIWNDVFMQYNKTTDGKYELLKQKNVDTGMGLERVLAIVNKTPTIYETELFAPLMRALEQDIEFKSELNDAKLIKTKRLIVDHLKAATFILAEKVAPSNVEQGYILRRLIRRVIQKAKTIGISKKEFITLDLAKAVIAVYEASYPELKQNEDFTLTELRKEENRFEAILEKNYHHLEQAIKKTVKKGQKTLAGDQAFVLCSTYGFPFDMIKDEAEASGLAVDEAAFKMAFDQHQKLSSSGSAKRFAGGLADHSAIATKYHTATHLLHQALRQVLGNHVEQKGSNITDARLRFDFSHPDKLTPEEIKQVEDIVNEQIIKSLPVTFITLPLAEAQKSGAIGLFQAKYGEQVKVFSIGNPSLPQATSACLRRQGQVFSKEICGGPHVKNTKELGLFKITKQEAVGTGVRRIKAILHGFDN